MKTFEKLQLGKEMITQLVVYRIISFKKHYKMIAIDLSKKQELDADPKALQQVSFTENQYGKNNVIVFFIIEEVKETILNF